MPREQGSEVLEAVAEMGCEVDRRRRNTEKGEQLCPSYSTSKFESYWKKMEELVFR